MQQDIYTVYKAQMIEAGIDGSLLRDGSDLGLYYVAQTDPDWRDYPFPNAASPTRWTTPPMTAPAASCR